MPGLRFSSDDVQADLRLQELSLKGDVVVLYDRFRLTSPSLKLERTPRGVKVRGDGRVVFCPCPDPPFAVGFSGALVAPPADLILQAPKLELFGVPVFALPWFWLRAPSRAGLLPPIVAWRGADGLLLGAGLHVPWKQSGDESELDLTGAGYSKGGLELTLRLRTTASTARLRFDSLKGSSLFAADARGSVPVANSGSVAWDIDAIRGSRARAGTLALEEAARSYDRGSIDVLVRASSAVVTSGLWATGARGGIGPGRHSAWGPRWTAGASGSLGDDWRATWDASSTVMLLQDEPHGIAQLARFSSGAEIDAPRGISFVRTGVRQSLTLAQTPQQQGFDASLGGRVEAGIPLFRVYPSDAAILAHTFEPRAEILGMASRASDAFWEQTGPLPARVDGALALAALGLRTSLGEVLGRSAAWVDLNAGALQGSYPGAYATRGAARFRAAFCSHFLALGAEGALVMGPPTAGQVTVARVALGRRESVRAQLGIAGMTGASPLVSRLFGAVQAEAPSGGWLSHEGWSGLGELSARPVSSLELGASVDGDLSAGALLGARSWAAYIHPCRCLRVDGFVAERVGRSGIDVWLMVDLAPR